MTGIKLHRKTNNRPKVTVTEQNILFPVDPFPCGKVMTFHMGWCVLSPNQTQRLCFYAREHAGIRMHGSEG
jgi:hypothetical protein